MDALTTELTLATWNLAAGRADDGWTTPLRGAHVTFLQEFTRAPVVVPSHRRWGSDVVLSEGHLEPLDLERWRGWVFGGRVRDAAWARGRDVFVFSLHAPTDSEGDRRQRYAKEVEALLATLAGDERLRSAELVIGGDFNFKSLGRRQPGEVVAEAPDERRVLKTLEAMGLRSCWSTAHPDAPLPQTLRWTKDPTRPFHSDGLFVPESWTRAGVRCEVLTSPDLVRLSDHHPVVATLTRPG